MGRSPTILVADDDADIRDLVVFRLERAGYEVVTAADGEQALRLARERRPDVCLVDLMMPGVDGYEVVGRLRGCGELAQTPVVLLTASVHEAAVERGYAVGADGYVKKPFTPAELLDAVDAALRSR